MSSLKPYSFCFDVVTRGSFANRAGLEIAITPGAALCMPCGETVPLPALGAPCPQCGSYQLTVAQGETMRAKEIEVA